MWNKEEIKAGRGRRDNSKKSRSFWSKQRRQDRAKERQASYDALTPQQKLDRIHQQLAQGLIPGEAKKERAKLAAVITGATQRATEETARQLRAEGFSRKRAEAIAARHDEQLDKMQAKVAKKGMRKAFNATPKELGEVAVKAAQKVYEPDTQELERRRQRAERWAQRKGRKDKREDKK